jgi:DNA-binding CsgD family transcriptional regulator/tetratricopeptide (TPR) repeat protein
MWFDAADGIDQTGPGWWAACVAGSVAFVGRERELSRLQVVVGGAARLLLVVGDAGVGKTRLVAEGANRAAAGGMVSAWGGCLPLAQTLPLLPVADALGELNRLNGGLVEAALNQAPEYVRMEMQRLLPQLGSGDRNTGEPRESGQRERLFSAVAEMLSAVAQRHPVVLVIEDVHWADSATLDCLTFLARDRGAQRPVVVVTCRSDEAPLDTQVAEWLLHVRGSSGVAEIRLGPLSRDEVAEQLAQLWGGVPSARVIDELYARGEGNPFFTEQLVAADATSTGAGLPPRLAELLAGRVQRCGGQARAVLAALAVAGRPLGEAALCAVSGLDVDVVLRGLRELVAAGLLGEASGNGEHRPRHALLAEAVAGELLAGERVALHEGAARALEAQNDDTFAAEAAGHWHAAGRRAEELAARVTAAEAAERVFGYAEAAGHWQRAIELCEALPDSPHADLPAFYVRAIDALDTSGQADRAALLAAKAFDRFADHPDPATAAVIHVRAAIFPRSDWPAAGLPLIKEALRLFEQGPPTAEQAEAWFHYARFLFFAAGRVDASVTALHRALEIAEAADAVELMPRVQASLAPRAFLRGEVEHGFAALDRARAVAEAADAGAALLEVAVTESDALLNTADFERALEVALRGLGTARRTGRHTSFWATLAISNAAEALLALGRTAEAGELIDPLSTAIPDRENFMVHMIRAEIDVLRGDLEAATRRLQQVTAAIRDVSIIEAVRESARRIAELDLWAGRPEGAVRDVRRVLALHKNRDMAIFCGRLLVAGMHACADLAERARARHDEAATQAALDAADQLDSWVGQMAGAPFTDHPFIAAIPAERATWDAEHSRLAGASDPTAWHAAAKTWESLGCPHRAGYAWWRHAEARLLAGQPTTAAATAIRAADAAADSHAPLLAAIHALAARAHIRLDIAPVVAETAPQPANVMPYGLTERELLVLRLLAAGRTNPQIGTELFISPKTASVHVTNILRKLGVTTRVQAASLAERAGLLDPS